MSTETVIRARSEVSIQHTTFLLGARVQVVLRCGLQHVFFAVTSSIPASSFGGHVGCDVIPHAFSLTHSIVLTHKLSLSISLSRKLSLALTQAHSLCLSVSLSFSLSPRHKHTLSLSLTHTHTNTGSLSLTHTHSHALSLSLSPSVRCWTRPTASSKPSSRRYPRCSPFETLIIYKLSSRKFSPHDDLRS